MTIDRWIAAAAARWPEKPALEFEGETWSYRDFAARIAARAGELGACGVGPRDRVAWYGLNHPEVFTLLFACARIGAILVPLNWRLAEVEIAGILADAAPKIVVHDSTFAEAAARLPGAHLLRPAGVLGTPPASVEDAHRADETAPLLLVYTSGSTGRPKGAVLTQAALIANAAMSVEAHDLTPNDRVLNVLPLFHVGGLNILPTPAFSIGATVVLHARFDPEATAEALQHVTHAITVPTVLQAVLATDAWANGDYAKLKALSIGSTDVPIPLIEAVHARGIPVLQIYGATETAPLAIYQRIGEAFETVGSIGRAGSGCAVRLVGPDGQDVPEGHPGEIRVKGPNILQRYWNDPDLTAQALQDGWFRTGDVARRDANGLYWFVDRIKHVIISGGENIYPAELERVLRDHPAIREVAVVGRPDPKWGEVPVAVVVSDAAIAQPDVADYLQGRIARYKHARDTVRVDALPRNAMGKVVAEEVRALIGADRGRNA